jgi:hypothetical protein
MVKSTSCSNMTIAEARSVNVATNEYDETKRFQSIHNLANSDRPFSERVLEKDIQLTIDSRRVLQIK